MWDTPQQGGAVPADSLSRPGIVVLPTNPVPGRSAHTAVGTRSLSSSSPFLLKDARMFIATL